MNAARKGAVRERKSMAIFEAAGYECIRAAASHGTWDFVAIGPHEIVLVQVKSRDWPYSLEEETLRTYVVPPNCRKLVHRWRERVPHPDVREY